MIPSATNQRQSASNIIANRTGQVNGQVHTNGYDCDDDIDVLRLRLRETGLLLQKTQHELKSRSENFEETVIRLKDKLVEADTKMKAQRSENETQMKNVISRLLNVEGELRNEHAEMEAVIKGKQKMIDIQEKRIKALEGSNIRLLRVLSNMRRNHSRQEDKDIDELLECLNIRNTPTEAENNGTSHPEEEDEVKHV